MAAQESRREAGGRAARRQTRRPAVFRQGVRHHRKLGSSTRSEAEAKVKTLGGRAGSNVTKKTSYLVVGEDSGSKMDKARKMGVTILSEEEFLKMIEKALEA